MACGSSTSGGTTNEDGGGATTGDGVALVNFVYATKPSDTYFEPTFTFGIRNDAKSAIQTLSAFAVDVGSAHAEGVFSTGDTRCTDPTGTEWKIPAGGQGGTVDGFMINGFGIDENCLEADSTGFRFEPAAPPVDYGGPITLSLKGTLADSTPFTATALGTKQ